MSRAEYFVPQLHHVITYYGCSGSQCPAEAESIYADIQSFFNITYMSESALELFKDVFRALQSGGVRAYLLDYDMGFGKTHFLIALLHAYYGFRATRYRAIEVEELFKKAGAKDVHAVANIVDKTIVLALDLSVNRYDIIRQLTLLEKQLSDMGCHDSARFVRDAVDRGRVPDGQILEDKINRECGGGLRLLALIDEIFYGVIKHDEGDEGFLDRIIKFAMDLKDGFESKGRPAVFVVAGAARDIQYAAQTGKVRDEGEAVNVAGLSLRRYFMERMGRHHASSPSRWITVEDAKRIVDRWIRRWSEGRAGYGDFHPIFDKVIRSSLEVRHSQHLRGLLKFMYRVWMNASERGHYGRITPEYVDPEAVSELLSAKSEGTKLVALYKSGLEHILGKFGGDGPIDRAAQIIAKAVFAVTAQSDEGELVELYNRLRAGDLSIFPTYSDLQDLLKYHGLAVDVDDVVGRIGMYIERREVEGGAVYFVTPSQVNLRRVFDDVLNRRLNECRFDAYEYWSRVEQLALERAEVKTLDRLLVKNDRGREGSWRPTDRNKIYIIVGDDKEELTRLLDGYKMYNVVGVLVDPSAVKCNKLELVGMALAEISQIYEHHMRTLDDSIGRRDLVDKILDGQVKDLETYVQIRVNRFIDEAADNLIKTVSKVLYFVPQPQRPTVVEMDPRIDRSKIKLNIAVSLRAREFSDSVAAMQNRLERGFADLFNAVFAQLYAGIKQGRIFFVDSEKYAEEVLAKNGVDPSALSPDQNIWPYAEGQWAYIFPNVLANVIQAAKNRRQPEGGVVEPPIAVEPPSGAPTERGWLGDLRGRVAVTLKAKDPNALREVLQRLASLAPYVVDLNVIIDVPEREKYKVLAPLSSIAGYIDIKQI